MLLNRVKNALSQRRGQADPEALWLGRLWVVFLAHLWPWYRTPLTSAQETGGEETPRLVRKEFPLSSLMATLSSARLARYLSACADDMRMAIECHY